MSIYSARSEIVITTPYFVPDEAVGTALLAAAERGVKVTVIIPDRKDSRLVHYTCRSWPVRFYNVILKFRFPSRGMDRWLCR